MLKTALKRAAITFAVMLTALLAFNAIGLVPAFAQDLTVGNEFSLLEGAPTDARSTVRVIINYFLGFLGLIAVIMIMYAGFLYLTAAGSDDNTGKAKQIIIYAIVGIIVILASAAIVNFALQATTNAPAASVPTSSGATL